MMRAEDGKLHSQLEWAYNCASPIHVSLRRSSLHPTTILVVFPSYDYTSVCSK